MPKTGLLLLLFASTRIDQQKTNDSVYIGIIKHTPLCSKTCLKPRLFFSSGCGRPRSYQRQAQKDETKSNDHTKSDDSNTKDDTKSRTDTTSNDSNTKDGTKSKDDTKSNDSKNKDGTKSKDDTLSCDANTKDDTNSQHDAKSNDSKTKDDTKSKDDTNRAIRKRVVTRN